MSRYKVLSLPSIFRENVFELIIKDQYIDSLKKIEPVFNRNGLYFDRLKNICWVECDHGCWVIGNSRDFNNELNYQTVDQLILHSDVIDAFKKLESHNTLSKEQGKLWWKHRHAVSLRNTFRSSKKWRLNIIGK